MKIRNDFVSNSSSSSFIVDKEKHGAWFSQLINIIRTIDSESIDTVYIWFDNQVDVLSILYKFKESIQKYKSDDYFDIGVGRKVLEDLKIKDEIVLSFHSLSLINIIRNNNDFINHIVRIRVDLKYDVRGERIYKQLEDTGLKFEWNR